MNLREEFFKQLENETNSYQPTDKNIREFQKIIETECRWHQLIQDYYQQNIPIEAREYFNIEVSDISETDSEYIEYIDYLLETHIDLYERISLMLDSNNFAESEGEIWTDLKKGEHRLQFETTINNLKLLTRVSKGSEAIKYISNNLVDISQILSNCLVYVEYSEEVYKNANRISSDYSGVGYEALEVMETSIYPHLVSVIVGSANLLQEAGSLILNEYPNKTPQENLHNTLAILESEGLDIDLDFDLNEFYRSGRNYFAHNVYGPHKSNEEYTPLWDTIDLLYIAQEVLNLVLIYTSELFLYNMKALEKSLLPILELPESFVDNPGEILK